MELRLKKLKEWFTDRKIDAGLITSMDNVFYLSGYRSDPHERLIAVIVLPNEEPILVCPSMEKEDAKQSGWKHEIIGYSDIQNPWELISQSLSERVKKIDSWAVEKTHLNVERLEQLQHYYPNAVFHNAEEKLQQLRMIKSEAELEIIRTACEFADYAIEIGVKEIAEGKSELEILATIEFELKKKGISEMSFSTMVLTGKNGASPHGNPGSTTVKKGDLVLFDLGVVYKGYCSDITRTVAFGTLNEEQIRIYETVLKAQKAAVAAVKPGVTAKEIDMTARKIIADAGYGDYFPHRLGHGLGISVHEYPSLTETNDLVLEEGMVFTIEPGIYVPGVAGVRIEDDLYITADGVETLTKYPKEWVYAGE